METTITKYDEQLKQLEDGVRFYISTPERFAEALVFSKKLKKFSEMIEEKVKTRGSEIMFEKDLKEIEFGDFKVVRVDPTKTIEFNVGQIIEVFGIDNAKQFLKSDSTKLQKYIIKARIEGEQLEKLNIGRKEKERIGYIKLLEVKKLNNPF